MLEINIPEREFFNESTSEFVTVPAISLKLEHSLLSIRKWESKWKCSFLNERNLTEEKFRSYIQCMTIGPVKDASIYLYLDQRSENRIKEYINDTMTATTFREMNNAPSREIITCEIIYYWMIEYGIPFECEKWHLNQLLTLIRVCGAKNASSTKKMSRSEIQRQNSQLNAARRKAAHSKG